MKRFGAERGVALMVVLWVVMVLSLLVAGFAFTMHVETQVASASRKELKALMLARSGVEVARMQLELHAKAPAESNLEALNQMWATNEELYVDHELGDGKFRVLVADEERKLPVNSLTEEQYSRLLEALGVDPGEADVIVDSITDWTDGNDLHQINGAETEYYQTLTPPYRAKNRAIDRVEEFLLIRGVTRELYEGTPDTADEPGRPGLRELLTVQSSGRVNVNTASALVLHVMFGLDEAATSAVVARRDGADGVSGTEDDQPYRNVDEFIREVGGADATLAQEIRQHGAVRSTCFMVTATGTVGNVRRTVTAGLKRQGNAYLVTSWTEGRAAL